MIVGMTLGLPLAFTLGGTAVVFTLLLWGPAALINVALVVVNITKSIMLTPVPLFIFMGAMLERSGIAEDLFTMMYRWMGPVRGGLAMGTVIICTIFAAMAGISGAATVTMGIVALPSMLNRAYKKDIAIGCIAAGGALGILIPPSIIMIIYAYLAEESVGRMFAGGILPGFLLSSMFILYIAIRSLMQKDIAPALPPEERVTWKGKFTSLRSVILPMLLVLAVLGSIFTGIATPTDAAAVGAFGSVVCAAIYRKLNWTNFKEAAYRTVITNGMVLWIVMGTSAFVAVYNALGAPELIRGILVALPLNPWVILIGIQATYFILGMFMDPIAIAMITVPIFLPVIKDLGFDTVWFGVLYVVNMEMAYLTPPFGGNLFYLRGVVPKGITMGDIYHSIWPFVVLQAVGLATVMIFPQLILWLPSILISK